MPSSQQIRCRPIEAPDLEVVVDLLTRGFPDRTRKYWATALEVLAARERLPGLPQFGYALAADGAVVGVHLLIFHRRGDGREAPVQCNTSALYVDPRYQSYAALLVSIASKLKNVIYLNTTASKHTWPLLEALGYRRYSEGQFVSIPALAGGAATKVLPLGDCAEHPALSDYALLRAHAEAGCLALVCETARGPIPFVFLRRRIAYAPIGVMQLVYCRDTADFVSLAGPLGRVLVSRGATCVILDADGPIPGLPGCFFRNKTPRYFKGPYKPRQNDLAFTEMVLFGP
ncbi:MAG TPA: hypothetical protein VN805_17225 [Caulobacteraceae bacterium]|nr:hypothetical protein [Caulobacteraceae bacterium]